MSVVDDLSDTHLARLAMPGLIRLRTNLRNRRDDAYQVVRWRALGDSFQKDIDRIEKYIDQRKQNEASNR